MDDLRIHNLLRYVSDLDGLRRKLHTCPKSVISEWNSTVSKIGQNRLNICMQPQLWYMISWIIDNPQDSLIHSHSRWEVAQGLYCMSNVACCAWAYARSNRHLFCSLKYNIVKTCSWNLSETYLSLIPVGCLVHRHRGVKGRQLISVGLHSDTRVIAQRQQIIHNLKRKKLNHQSFAEQFQKCPHSDGCVFPMPITYAIQATKVCILCATLYFN